MLSCGFWVLVEFWFWSCGFCLHGYRLLQFFFFNPYVCETFLRVFSLNACGQVAAHKDKLSKQAEILNGRLST